MGWSQVKTSQKGVKDNKRTRAANRAAPAFPIQPPPRATEHADGGTVLQPEDCAIVVRGDGKVYLAIPKMKAGENVPEHLLALTAMYIRWQREPEWVADLNQWFKAQVKN